MSFSAGHVMGRLDGIDKDLETRQPEFEKAASDYYHAKREFEKAQAEEYVKAEGKNQEERRSKALIQVAYHREEWTQLKVAEANYEAHKAANRTLETRAQIGMSLLKSMGREAFPRAA